MRSYSALISAVVAIFTLSAQFSLATSPASVAPPVFKHLLTGTIITNALDPKSYIVSPYGRRLTGATYIGGNWTDHTGKLIAEVYPNVGGDSGITDPTGILHVDTRMTWQFVEDGSFAWMHAIGPGIVYKTDDLYIEIETDSPRYNCTFNNRFLIGQGSFHGSVWTIQLFGL